jgi:hypothetical protein
MNGVVDTSSVNLSSATQIGVTEDRFTSETSAIVFGAVPNLPPGTYNIIFCYRNTEGTGTGQSQQWYFGTGDDFTILEGTPEPTVSGGGESDTPTVPVSNTPTDPPTSTPVVTATPTPTPSPTASPVPTLRPVKRPFFGFFWRPLLPDFWRALILPTYDLSISGMEVTQAIQCFDTTRGLAGCTNNSLPLVAQKSTLARTYLGITGSATSKAGVPVRLHIFAGGVEYKFDSWGTAREGAIRQDYADDARVWFNVNFPAGTTADFYVEVDPDNTYPEINESNNRFPPFATMPLTFTAKETLEVTDAWMNYNPPGAADSGIAISPASLWLGRQWLNQVFPLRNNGINMRYYGLLNWTTVINANDEDDVRDLGKVLWLIENIFPWSFGTLTGAERFHIWTPNSHFVRGISDPPWDSGQGVVSVGDDNADIGPPYSVDSPGFGAVNYVHEVAHNSGMRHTATGRGQQKSTTSGNVACDNSGDPSSDWPYTNPNIQEYGINPDTGVIYEPLPRLPFWALGLSSGNQTYDFMSYCYGVNSLRTFTNWISPFHWQQAFNDLSAADAGVAQPAGIETGPIIAVTAMLDNPDVGSDDGGEFGTLYKSEEGPVISPNPGNAYSVQIRDGDVVLSTQAFDVSFENVDDPESPLEEVMVVFTIPFEDGTSVVLLRGAQVLDTFAISDNAPTVTVTDPASHDEWSAGTTETLSWSGNDADGEPLTYAVYFAPNGDDFTVIAAELTDSSLQINVDDLKGAEDGVFRVVASDGLNTSFADSASVEIPNHAPMVNIANPADGAFGEAGGLIVFNAVAVDLEDGTLVDESLTWESDLDGEIGVGEQLPLNSLSAGVHEITLAAEDSGGETSTATITLTVGVLGNMFYLPGVVDPLSNDDVTAIVTLMPSIPTTDIDESSLILHLGNEQLTPTSTEQLGDTDQDGLPELAVTFDGGELRSAVPGVNGLVPTRLTGSMDDDTAFEARAHFAFLSAGDTNCDGEVNGLDISAALGAIAEVDEPACLYAGDHNCDNDVTVPDVFANLQSLADIEVAEPQGCVIPAAVIASVPTAVSVDGGASLLDVLANGWLAVGLAPAAVFVGRRRKH